MADFTRTEDYARLIETLRAKYLNSWENTRPDDVTSREQAYRMIQAVEALKNEISSLANDPAVRAFNGRRTLDKRNVIR